MRIEVAHEALINAWPRLVRWRQEDAEIVRVRDQLRASARQWAERDRPRGLLWRDEVLAEYRLWRTRYTGALTEVEQHFARASVEQADRALRRRRVLVTGAFAVLAAGAIAMSLLSVKASRSADEATRSAGEATRSAGEAKKLLVDSYFEQARTALLDGRNVTALDYIHRAHDAGLDSLSLQLMNAYARPSVSSEIAQLDAHGGKVSNLIYSPDGARIYSAHEDGGIRVWDAVGHRLLATWSARQPSVRGLRLSRDGRWLASSNDDGVADVWDTETGRVIAEHKGPVGQFSCLQLDTEQRLMVTAGVGYVWIGDPMTGRTLQDIRYDGFTFQCAIDPKGRWVVTGNVQGTTADVWDIATGKRILAMAHDGGVSDLALSRDGTLLATASSDGNVRLWSLPDGRLLHAMPGHGAPITAVRLSPDSKRLVSVGDDLTARVWDVARGAALLTLRHNDPIHGARLDASGDHLITTSPDGTARLWDLRSGRLVKSVSGSTAGLVAAQFSSDGKAFAAGSREGVITLWQSDDPFHVDMWPGETAPCPADNRPYGNVVIATCQHFTHVLDLRTHSRIELPPASEGSVAADGRHAVTYAEGVMTAWDLDTRTAQQHVAVPARPTALVWSRNADSVAIGTERGDVLVWPISGTDPPAKIFHHAGSVTSMAWNPAGLLVTGDDRGQLHMARVGGAGVDLSVSLKGAIVFVQFSHDGRIFGAATGRWIELRDAGTLEVFARLEHGDDATTFDFDSQGQRVVSGAQDGIVRVWRVRDGTLLAGLTGANKVVLWSQFVGEQVVVATGGDGMLRFWDVGRSKQIFALAGNHAIGTAVLHTNPYTYLLQSFDGSLISWDLPPTAW